MAALASFFYILKISASADFEEIFSVSVPTSLPLAVLDTGQEVTPAELKVINNSSLPIAVTSIDIAGLNSWEIKSFDEDFTAMRPGTQSFALSFEGKGVPESGLADVSGIEPLDPYEERYIKCEAKIALQIKSYENEQIGQCLFTVGWQEGALYKIEITSMPYKLSYLPGQNFASDGLTVEAVYLGGGREEIDDYEILSGQNLYEGQEKVTVTYEGKSAEIEITVKNSINGIKIVTPPTKTVYESSETFSPSGMVVNAVFEDGTEKEISDYTYSPSTVDGTVKYIEISYVTEDGDRFCAYQEIYVKRYLIGFYLASYPVKLTYANGESFDKTGVSAIATYSDGSSDDVTEYINADKTVLYFGDEKVTFSYDENGKMFFASVDVTVTRNLTGIYAATYPDKTIYKSGESFDKTGLKVIAVYEGGYEKEVTDYTCSYGTFTFIAPPSTLKTYVTVDYMTSLYAVAEMFGLDFEEFLSWNGLEGHAYIKPDGVTLYVSNPALDEAVTCTQNDIYVTVTYEEDGTIRTCEIPVTVTKS